MHIDISLSEEGYIYGARGINLAGHLSLSVCHVVRMSYRNIYRIIIGRLAPHSCGVPGPLHAKLVLFLKAGCLFV